VNSVFTNTSNISHQVNKFNFGKVNNKNYLSDTDYENYIKEESKIYSNNFSQKIKRKKLPLCKICLSEENTEENPLINPCKCIGSVGLTHLECLRTWLHSKLTKRTAGFLTLIAFKRLACEICKGKIPEKIKFQNKVYSLIQPNNPEKSFLMFEAISKESSETKYIYIIQLNEGEKLTLGRSNESDIKLNDISVSRLHATLTFLNNSFYISDNDSKFGSLVKLQSSLVVIPSQTLFIQYGKFYLNYNAIKPCFLYIICGKNSKYSKQTYNEILEKLKNNEDIVELHYITESEYVETETKKKIEEIKVNSGSNEVNNKNEVLGIGGNINSNSNNQAEKINTNANEAETNRKLVVKDISGRKTVFANNNQEISGGIVGDIYGIRDDGNTNSNINKENQLGQKNYV